MYCVIYQTTNKSNLKYFFFIMIAFAFESKVIYKKVLLYFIQCLKLKFFILNFVFMHCVFTFFSGR